MAMRRIRRLPSNCIIARRVSLLELVQQRVDVSLGGAFGAHFRDLSLEVRHHRLEDLRNSDTLGDVGGAIHSLLVDTDPSH
jgi:hypothetical protein